MSQIALDIGRSAREAFFMFWATLWALVLGFALSGAVQAFVSRDEMQRRLGSRGPRSLGRASLYGMVSSSCSYAASAMAKSLYAKGADFLAAMVFMFASTNLVFELGIVLVVLIGWQFLAAELVGGALMIVLLAGAGGVWFRGRALAEADEIARGEGAAEPSIGGGDREPWGRRLRSSAGWADAATYTMGDLRMLRREMVIGFSVAGALAVTVPTRIWNDVFLHGHGFWTSLENVIVGPLVAIISFVCSVGNVPLAAALWKGGISFGGVVSFIFADLITLPLLLIYRKQYGPRMAVRMLAVFWGVMSAAGLATEYLFRAAGWVPSGRPTVIAGEGVRFDYTSVLDVLALVAFSLLYWVYRNRTRLGGGQGYATDPVCGMQVELSHAPAWLDSKAAGHGRLYFCSEHCRARYESGAEAATVDVPTSIDPVCGMTVDPAQAAARRRVGGDEFHFCGTECADEFDRRGSAGDLPAR